jgi:hypothetical protein
LFANESVPPEELCVKRSLSILSALMALGGCAASADLKSLEGQAELRGPARNASLFLVDDVGATWSLICIDRARLVTLDGLRVVVTGSRAPGLSVHAPGTPLFCVKEVLPR